MSLAMNFMNETKGSDFVRNRKNQDFYPVMKFLSCILFTVSDIF